MTRTLRIPTLALAASLLGALLGATFWDDGEFMKQIGPAQ